jgi:hypothetical protein
MDAPVGVLEEEAGDAGLLLAPHHVQGYQRRLRAAIAGNNISA